MGSTMALLMEWTFTSLGLLFEISDIEGKGQIETMIWKGNFGYDIHWTLYSGHYFRLVLSP